MRIPVEIPSQSGLIPSLIDACEDAAWTLGLAAQLAADRGLRIRLTVLAEERTEMSLELLELTLHLGPPGPPARRLESAFTRNREALDTLAASRGHDVALLRHCARADLAAVERYQSIARPELPRAVWTLLDRHLGRLRSGVVTLKELCGDAAAAA